MKKLLNIETQVLKGIILSVIILLPVLLFLVLGILNQVESSSKIIFSFLYSIVLFLAVLVIINPRRLLIVLTPIALISPFYNLHIVLFNTYPTEGIFFAAFDSNWQESIELLSSNWLLLLINFFLVGYYLYQLRKITPQKYSGKLKVIGFSVLLALTVFMFVRDVNLSKKLRYPNDLPMAISDGWDQFLIKYNKIYPIDIPKKMYSVLQNKKAISRRNELLSDYTFGAQSSFPKRKEVCVVIIGESARSDHFSLNDYPQWTNPLLETQSVLSFKNAYSNANLTSISLPLVFNRTEKGLVSKFDSEKSFIEAFNNSGFETYWISNQEQHQVINQISNDAQNVFFLHGKNKLDHDLLPIVDSILMSPNNKKLIVLHTMGSHFRYNHRYSKEFNTYKPSIENDNGYSNILQKSNSQKLINTYDNSILYTDFLISECIDLLKTNSSYSTLTYFSDHGESLFDTDKNMVLHATPTAPMEQLNVPLIVWTNDSIINVKLCGNLDKNIDLTTLFHTIPLMHDISFDKLKQSESLLDKNYVSLKNLGIIDVNYQKQTINLPKQ